MNNDDVIDVEDGATEFSAADLSTEESVSTGISNEDFFKAPKSIESTDTEFTDDVEEFDDEGSTTYEADDDESQSSSRSGFSMTQKYSDGTSSAYDGTIDSSEQEHGHAEGESSFDEHSGGELGSNQIPTRTGKGTYGRDIIDVVRDINRKILSHEMTPHSKLKLAELKIVNEERANMSDDPKPE